MAPEMEADGICQTCHANPGTLMMDPIQDAMYGYQVPVVLCVSCREEAQAAT